MQLDSFFPFAELPWLRYVLALIVTGLGFWLAASPVAYAAYRVLRTLREGLRSFLDTMTQRIAAGRMAQLELRKKQRQQALAGNVIHKRDARRLGFWDETVTSLLRPIISLSKQVADSDLKFRAVEQSMQRLIDRLSRFDPGTTQQPTIANSDVNVQQLTGARDAWPMLVIGLILLAAITVVNTGMLGQILRDGIIPPSLMVANIPLFWVLAALLTLAEAGTGYLHSALIETTPPNKPAIGALFVSLLAIVIAFVEGFFYSRIGANRPDTFTVPIFNVTMPFEQIFFLWGFALVMALFGVGMMVTRYMLVVRRAGNAEALRKHLRSTHNEIADLSNATARTIQTLNNDIAAALAKYQQFSTTNAGQKTPILDVLQELRQRLELLQQQPPAWVQSTQEQAEDPDWHKLELRAALIAWLTIVLVGVLIFLATPWLASLMAGVQFSSAFLIASGYALLFPAAGFLLRATHAVHPDMVDDQPRLLENVRGIDTFAIIVLATAVALLGVSSIFAGTTAPWIISVILGVLLVLCGRELASLLYFVGVHFGRLWDLTVYVLQRVVLLVVWSIYLMLLIAEHVCAFLAAPVQLLIRSRTPSAVGSLQR